MLLCALQYGYRLSNSKLRPYYYPRGTSETFNCLWSHVSAINNGTSCILYCQLQMNFTILLFIFSIRSIVLKLADVQSEQECMQTLHLVYQSFTQIMRKCFHKPKQAKINPPDLQRFWNGIFYLYVHEC